MKTNFYELRIEIICILFLILSACSNHKTKQGNESGLKNVTLKKESVEVLVDSAFADGGEVIYPDTFYLKNDYTLFMYLTSDSKYYYYNVRLKGNDIDTLIWNMAIMTRKYLPYFDGIDFDDYFGISYTGGGNCSLYISLFEKKSGRSVLSKDERDASGFDNYQGNYDLKNNLLIYEEQGSVNPTLFDLKNNKKTTIEESFNDPCFGGMCNFSFYSFHKVTDKMITIEYYNCDCKRKYQFKIPR